jgi:hypothetical protein
MQLTYRPYKRAYTLYRSSLLLLNNNAHTVSFVAFANNLVSGVNNLQLLTVQFRQRTVIRFSASSVIMYMYSPYVWPLRPMAMVSWCFLSAKPLSFLRHSHGTLHSCIKQLYDIVQSSKLWCFHIITIVFHCFPQCFDCRHERWCHREVPRIIDFIEV